MPADNDAKAAVAAEPPRSAGQTEAERNGLVKKPKAPSGVDLGGRSFADDKKKAMEERMQRGRDLLNGPRGQNTAHRMQHIYRALSQEAEYPFEPTPLAERDFPALTPSQRLHLEVNGYVVVECAARCLCSLLVSLLTRRRPPQERAHDGGVRRAQGRHV